MIPNHGRDAHATCKQEPPLHLISIPHPVHCHDGRPICVWLVDFFAELRDVLVQRPRRAKIIHTPDRVLTPAELRAFGAVDIHEADPLYFRPLLRDARKLARQLTADGTAILLGSIATAKYRDVLLDVFGERLVFPQDFVGRGDMSRGALMLRAARSGTELPYFPVRGAIYKGKRAPRIADMK